MATADDIDSQKAVRKFLDRPVVGDREDKSSDSSTEISAILEACATAFLLTPQVALVFVMQAKNILQQVVGKDLELLDYMSKAVDDVNNPNELISDTSDLVEAQTALVELDRLGKVSSDLKAYGRYASAVNRFLDVKLANSLKRRRRKEFERSGTEAKQDLFRVLSVYGSVHQVLIDRLGYLYRSVSDFNSVDLTRVVATKTLAYVRSSLTKVINGIDQRTLSKTSIAVELLAGSAALTSISRTSGIYDPLVDTGSFPVWRTIQIKSEAVAAFSVGAPVSLLGVATPWSFQVASVNDAGPSPYQTVYLPAVGASGRAFVLSDKLVGGVTLASDTRTLYLQLDGITPGTGEGAFVCTITFSTGLHTLTDLVSSLNTALGANGTAAVLGDRLLIFGSSSVTKVTVRASVPGTFTPSYTPAALSAHVSLGFSGDLASSDPNVFSVRDLAALIEEQATRVSVAIVDEKVVLRSQTTATISSLSFLGGVAVLLGFSNAVAEPSYLTLTEAGVEIDPASLGILLGSLVGAADQQNPSRTMSSALLRIDGAKMFFGVPALPRCLGSSVLVVSPLVNAVKTLLSRIKLMLDVFAGDTRDLQRVLSIMLSNPTLAQINDAKRVVSEVRGRVTALQAVLTPLVVSPEQNGYLDVANHIVLSLEDRGLDRAVDLLKKGSFSEFFGLTSVVASKSSRLLRAVEEVGRNDFSKTAVEGDMEDPKPRGSTPDESILAGAELSNPYEDPS